MDEVEMIRGLQPRLLADQVDVCLRQEIRRPALKWNLRDCGVSFCTEFQL